MGVFSNNEITDAGRVLMGEVQMGATLDFTKIVMGSGFLPAGTTARTITAVVSPVTTLTINKKKMANDGTITVGGAYSNESIVQDFYFRELAIFAKATRADGTEVAEVLYGYANAGNNADLMPAYTSGTPVERQIDLSIYIGNDTEVNLTIEGGLFLTKDEADDLYVQQGTDGNRIDVVANGVKFNNQDRYAMQNYTSAFPASTTILQFANSCNVTTSVLCVQGNLPTDAPVQQEAHIIVNVGNGGRKTVVFMPFNAPTAPTYTRDIFNSAWLDNAWRPSGGFAQETAEDLHTIMECKTVQCFSNTLNTPYKEGLTNAAHGVCIVARTGNFATLLYMATSSNRGIYLQYCQNGVWGPWQTISIVGAINSNAIFVGPTGSDTTGNGTESLPYASLAKALSMIPKDLGGQTIVINVASGTYTEATPVIQNFYGGQLLIIGNSTTPPEFSNGIQIDTCSARVVCQFINTKATAADKAGFLVYKSNTVEILNSKVTANTAGQGYGVHSAFMATVYADNCTLVNCAYPLAATWGELYTGAITGSGNTYSAFATAGGRIGIQGTVPSYQSAQYLVSFGGRIYKDGQIAVPRY